MYLSKFGIFFSGVIFFGIFDLIVQLLFKQMGGRALKHNHIYHFYKHISLFLPPLGGLLMLLIFGIHRSVYFFFVSAVTGTLVEYSLGRFLYILHGRPVWEYQYLSLGRFTSWLSFVYWGGAGLLFVKIANLLNW